MMQNEYEQSNKLDRLDWVTEIPSGWELIKLKFVCKLLSSNVDKKYHDDEIEVKLCNYTDVYYNEIIDNNLDLMVATVTENEKQKFTIKENDVIITKDSESFDDIAIPAIVGNDHHGIVCGYHLAILRSDPQRLYGQYLYWFLTSEVGNFQYQINANGVTRYGLPKYWINNSFILLPSLIEQKKISDFLYKEDSRIKKIINLLGGQEVCDGSSPDSMIGKLIMYRSTLLNNVLTGKIRIYENTKESDKLIVNE
ncbi:restriction endonuclease subunit S [Legionella pneumophila serogroup 1]